MSERMRFITHRGKKILLLDFSDCLENELEQLIRTVPDIVAKQPRASVLILVDYTRTTIDKESLWVMKETAVFNKPYVRKSAWVRAESFPDVHRETLKSFSGRDFPTFKTREDALEWLTVD